MLIFFKIHCCPTINDSFFLTSLKIFVLECNQPNFVGDGYCNDETNILECGFDKGDCCGSCIITESCTNCSCIGYTREDEISNVLVGDGYCNDITNNQQCNFDGGDCCGSCIITDYCTNCSCIGDSIGNEVFSVGVDALIGDGFCHDMLNNVVCNYDNGDCCNNQLINNGFCNDETNIQRCFYDGGDCCVNVNTDYCSNCSCAGSGVITSPRYPGNYDNNLDLAWLIQLPLRQLIKIDFITFDVEDHSSCK